VSDVVGGAEHAVVVMGTVALTTMGWLVSCRRSPAGSRPLGRTEPKNGLGILFD
jgi:hypothetical protein